MNLEWIKFRMDWFDVAASLPDEERLELFDSISSFVLSGSIPKNPLFRLITDTIGKDIAKAEEVSQVRSEAGRKGMKSRWKLTDSVEGDNKNNNCYNKKEDIRDKKADIRDKNQEKRNQNTDREGEEDVGELLRKVKDDSSALSSLRTVFPYENISKRLDEFVRYLEAKCENRKTYSDFRSHFVNWLNKERNKTKNLSETEKILHNADTFTTDTAGTNDFE